METKKQKNPHEIFQILVATFYQKTAENGERCASYVCPSTKVSVTNGKLCIKNKVATLSGMCRAIVFVAF